MDFQDLFARATGGDQAYPFQRRFAERRPSLVRVPTGLGKTAMAILGWVWRRRYADARIRAATPRRLVYCLPMRVLVEQTRDNSVLWLHNLGLLAGTAEFDQQDMEKKLCSYTLDFGNAEKIAVHVLMGGEQRVDWDLYPEHDAIIIGTQDMLLSRALNRGYAMSRARWPMHFALLSNDTLWVLDEIQLMGSGLATTVQLDAFRQAFGSHGTTRSIWMSATLNQEWLNTVDCDPAALGDSLELDNEDRAVENVQKRREAPKPLTRTTAVNSDAQGIADEVLAAHEEGTRTLIVVNTVRRARALMKALEKQAGSEAEAPHLVLIHSRFRPAERRRQIARLLTEPRDQGTIIVSTQVVEAGVDVSAKRLFTEVAPWASLVQRFGRCNRRGEFATTDGPQVYWIDLEGLDDDAKKSAKAAPPYSPAELLAARQQLIGLDGRSVAPETLEALDVELSFEHTHVIRRKDLIELFDTTPDLAGNDLDIDRYVRDVDDSDVRVFWREMGGDHPRIDEPSPTREELCPAPIGEFKKFVEKLGGSTAYRRNFLEGTWERVSKGPIVPGQVYLLDTSAGGYDPQHGWTGIPGDQHVASVLEGDAEAEEDSNDADKLSQIDVWQTIAEHTDAVCAEVDMILGEIDLPEAEVLRSAARWHDWGKAHAVFQAAIDDGEMVERRRRIVARRERPAEWQGCRFVAKAPRKERRNGADPGYWRKYDWVPAVGRKHFRHELASALGFLITANGTPETERDLIAYVIAAHHGKVRLSIRSLPEENHPPDNKRFARGLWDGDPLPETDLGDGVRAPAVTLSLEPMEIGLCQEPPFAGQRSWLERTLRLRDALGPFRLAYVEALLRAADMRASAKAGRA